jgi:hypothetical protein
MDKINRDIASIILAYAGYFNHGRFFDAIYPGVMQQCYNMNIHIEKVYVKWFDYYRLEYTLFGKLHRENDLPAVERDTGTLEWYYKGRLYRADDKPAIIYGSGTRHWYYNDKLHRSNDLPAIIYSNDQKEWYTYGRFIRRETSREWIVY